LLKQAVAGDSIQPFTVLRPASRSSSMQAETGSARQTIFANVKPSAKGPSDLTYSMQRWLDEKPSDEPWRGSSR
jgi:hypothetical protein